MLACIARATRARAAVHIAPVALRTASATADVRAATTTIAR
ncbi:Uncharacterised protein [Mycobacteroides abscessus]|nr:Uncharacterised protein [Mycobacteroides abscessus]